MKSPLFEKMNNILHFYLLSCEERMNFTMKDAIASRNAIDTIFTEICVRVRVLVILVKDIVTLSCLLYITRNWYFVYVPLSAR